MAPAVYSPMKGIVVPLIAVFALVALAFETGCATQRETGTVVGGLGGAVVGEQLIGGTAGVLIGGAIGAVLGHEIGRALDERDAERMHHTFERAPTHQPTTWRNPDTGYGYELTPTETYYRDDGLPCREFRLHAEMDYDIEEVWGTACRQPDGSWQIVG